MRLRADGPSLAARPADSRNDGGAAGRLRPRAQRRREAMRCRCTPANADGARIRSDCLLCGRGACSAQATTRRNEEMPFAQSALSRGSRGCQFFTGLGRLITAAAAVARPTLWEPAQSRRCRRVDASQRLGGNRAHVRPMEPCGSSTRPSKSASPVAPSGLAHDGPAHNCLPNRGRTFAETLQP